jgi:RimJ/RimL family protein N-acetyltransferase
MIDIRGVTLRDGSGLLELRRRLAAESEFLLFDVDECPQDIGAVLRQIQQILHSGHGTLLLAVEGDRPIGFLTAVGSASRKVRHCATIGLGVLEERSGQGVATRLLEAAERWAQSRGVNRLELIVAADNVRAIGLYKKCGYELEGIKRRAWHVGDRYVDGHVMAKLLPDSAPSGDSPGEALATDLTPRVPATTQN